MLVESVTTELETALKFNQKMLQGKNIRVSQSRVSVSLV